MAVDTTPPLTFKPTAFSAYRLVLLIPVFQGTDVGKEAGKGGGKLSNKIGFLGRSQRRVIWEKFIGMELGNGIAKWDGGQCDAILLLLLQKEPGLIK